MCGVCQSLSAMEDRLPLVTGSGKHPACIFSSQPSHGTLATQAVIFFPREPSVQKLSSVFLIDFLPHSLEVTHHPSRPFPPTLPGREFISLVFRGDQYDMWDLRTLLYKQLPPLLGQLPPFVLSKAYQASRLSSQELHPHYWISTSYLHSILASHYKGSTMQAILAAERATLRAYTPLQS